MASGKVVAVDDLKTIRAVLFNALFGEEPGLPVPWS